MPIIPKNISEGMKTTSSSKEKLNYPVKEESEANTLASRSHVYTIEKQSNRGVFQSPHQKPAEECKTRRRKYN